MQRTFVLNGKTINARKITTNMVCEFSEEGIDFSKGNAMTTFIVMRSYLAKCLNIPVKEAGKRIDEHCENGGDINELMTVFNEEVAESGFFQALNRMQNAISEQAEETQGENF